MTLQNRLRRQMEAEPVQFLWRRYEERLEPSRQVLADFVGARARDVVFVTNATSAVNAVLRSVRLNPGDEVLTTSLDYNACHNVLVEATRAAGASLVTAEVAFPIRNEDELVGSILAKVSARTRLAFLDHVTSNTALVLPLERLARELEAKGVDTLVDGAHSPGMIPLNIPELGVAFYTGNLHKWVCAPKGAAFLWAREDKQAALQPAVISHGNNTPREGFSPYQDRFDWTGTFDPSAWFCVGDAIRYMGGLLAGGWEAIRQHNRTLAKSARDQLCARFGVEPPCPESMLGSMATIPLPAGFQGSPKTAKIDPEQLALYDRFGVEVPLVRVGATRYCRISAQVYNTEAEYAYFAAALEALTSVA